MTTKANEYAAEVLRARLNVSDAGFAASDKVRRALETIQPYLDTWVLPVVNSLVNEQWCGQRRQIRADAAEVRARRSRKAGA